MPAQNQYSPQKIIQKLNDLKRRNAEIFGPLLSLSPRELLPADVSDAGLTRSDIRDKIKKIYNCAGLLEFRANYSPDDTGELQQSIKLHNATYCKAYTVCEICARRVQFTRWKRFKEPIEKMIEKYPHVYHVTFTIKDANSLDERIRSLGIFFRDFVRKGQKRGVGKSLGQWSKVGAAIVATESKRGDNSDLWHAHKHALIFCRERLDFRVYDEKRYAELIKKYGRGNVPKSELTAIALQTINIDGREVPVSPLSREWFSATKGQGISVYARKLRGDILSVAKEVLKYPVKTSLRHKSDIPEIIDSTYGKRFLATYGDFRGMEKDEFALPETAERPEIWLSAYDREKRKYSPPQISKKAIIDVPEKVKKILWTRLGKAVGEYRKRRGEYRKEWKISGNRILCSLAGDLDNLKAAMRREISQIWQHFSLMPVLAGNQLSIPAPAGPDAEQLFLPL